MAAVTIGERIAAQRRRRGISQVVLAGLIGRSESWLSQVERGARRVDSLAVILQLARVLRVEPSQLIGKSWQERHDNRMEQSLAPARRYLVSHEPLARPAQVSSDLARLQDAIERAHSTYQDARYAAAAELLPEVLSLADQAVQASTETRTANLLAYVSAYVVAAKLFTKVGADDLAHIAADRAATAAVESGSMVARGMAAYQVVCAMLRTGQVEDAEHLATAVAGSLEPSNASTQQAELSVAGALWLIASVVAARRMDREAAWARLARADTLARTLGHDGNYAWTAFGPTNVALHRVAVASELGDSGEAVRAGEAVDPNHFPAGLTSRKVQLHLDLAWAHAQRRRDAEATLHLLDVERIAPEVLRFNVSAHAVMREMVARARHSQTSSLADLAERAGALD